jgi:integrase
MMHLESHFGPGMHLSDIGPAEVLQYAIEAKKERKAITVLRELECLQQAYRTLGLTPPKMPDVGDTTPKPQRVLEVHEQRSLLMAVPPRRRLSVQAYLQLGLRQSELWKIESIDWVARYVIVGGTKTKGSRRDAARERRATHHRAEPRDDWRACFPKWGKSAQHQCLGLAGERAGIGPVHCNDLRGTFATMHARAGTPQMVLAAIMGNSPKMLEKVYAQLKIRGEHHHEFTKRGVPRLKSASPLDGVGQADEAVGDCAQSVRETVAHTANTDTKRGGKLVSIRRKD